MEKEIENILTDSTKQVKKNVIVDIREELKPYLNRKIQASGRVEKLRISTPKSSGSSSEIFMQLLLKDVKLINQNQDLNHHVNIFIPINQLGRERISIGNRIIFQAIVRQYKTYKPIEGIMIKLKNYSFNDIKVLEIEK